jgi:transposase
MRFVAVKSEEQQAAALVFRTRDLLVRQRTQLGNAIRGHMTEYGWIAPKWAGHLAMLADLLEDHEMASTLPEAARAMFAMMVDMLAELDKRIAALDQEIARRAREDEVVRRLMTIPGIGPITATAIAALAPPAETFKKGRDFAAWLGLVPRQASTGGKQKLGAVSKMGERTLRRLLIIGSSSVVLQASKRGAPKGSWLEGMLARSIAGVPSRAVIKAITPVPARSPHHSSAHRSKTQRTYRRQSPSRPRSCAPRDASEHRMRRRIRTHRSLRRSRSAPWNWWQFQRSCCGSLDVVEKAVRRGPSQVCIARA